jgi:ABC-type nitrate/sulfonate/bicarbonate transport system substrate-binding protein
METMTKSDMLVNRRTTLAMMAAGVLAAASGARAAAPLEQTKIQIGGNRDPQLGAQIIIAHLKNFFKDEGLDASVSWTDTSGDLLPLMAGGSINLAGIGMSNLANLTARGVPVKGIASLCDYSGTQALVLRPGLTLKSPKDLAGRKFAAPTTSPHEMAIGELGQRYGFDASTVTLARMQPSEGVVAAARGDVDGVLTYPPFLGRILDMGGTLYFTGSATYFDGKETRLSTKDRLLNVRSVLAGNEDWMKANPNTTLAVMRAILKGNDFITANLEETSKLLADFLKSTPDVMLQSLKANVYSMSMDEGLLGSMDFTSGWLQKIGQLKAPIVAATSLDTSWLAKIDPKLVSIKI